MPSQTLLTPVVNWANTQPQPGSFLDVGSWRGTDACLALDALGWRGVYIDPAPDAIAQIAGQGLHGIVLCAALSGEARKAQPTSWTPDAPTSQVGVTVRAPGIIPILSAAIHPSELFELWDPTTPVLPEPRFASVDVGPGTFTLLELLVAWVKVDLLRVTVPTDDEAASVGRWLGAGWRVLATEGLTLVAQRLT